MSKEGLKTAAESVIDMHHLVMPNHANPLNSIFGGVIMSWIDLAAGMVAMRHAARPVVTAHVDSLSFLAAVKVGDQVHIKASVNYVGTTSFEIGCKVMAENPITGKCEHTTSAYLTFVALDDQGKPTKVPGLKIVTKEEKKRFEDAKKRVQHRKELRSARN